MYRFVAERTKRGWSQSQLARATELHPAVISQLENGTMKMFPKYRRRIADVLDLDENQLLEKVELVMTIKQVGE